MQPNSVSLILEGISADRLDSTLVSAARRALSDVPGLGETEVVVAVNLSDAVRRRLSPDEAAAFVPDRVTGSVGAKTLFLQDGPCIVIDGRLLLPAAAAAGVDVPRLFAHEGWHVAVRNRDENFSSAFARLKLTGAAAHLVGQALIVVEEFRVERALGDQGLALHDTYEQSTAEVLVELRRALLDAITLRYRDEDINRTYDSALRAFNAFTIHFAYLAADHVSSSGARTIGVVASSPSWERYVGSNWDDLIELLEPLPSAEHSMAMTELEAAGTAIGSLLQRWLRDVGFDLNDLPGGELYFDVLRHDF